MSKTEKLIVLAASLIVTATYTYWIHFRFPLAQADSAFLAQMVERMGQTGRPISQIAEAIRYLFVGFDPLILMTPAKELCLLGLPGPGPEEFNVFRWHSLISLYFYIPLFKVVGGPLGLSLLTAISYLTIVFGSYVLLRKQGVSILFASMVALPMMLHPVWAGGILGQFYADRLWIGPAFVLCALLLTRQFDWRWVIPLAILLTLTSERMGVIVGALLIGSVVLADPLKPEKWWNRRLIVTGLLCAAFSGLVFRFFEVHPHYENFRNSMQLENFLSNFRETPGFASRLWTFAAVNLIAWGLPGIGCWRGLLLSAGVMLPNILGNFGGAEKTGWLTHYHSLYFPVLAATICLSFVQLYRKYPRWASWAFVTWLAVVGFGFNINLSQYDFQFGDLASRSFAYPFRDYNSETQIVAVRLELAAYLDQFPGSRISMPEIYMSLLYPNHSIAYYPMGIDDSDFVVIPKGLSPGQYAGVFSYLGEEETRKIDQCMSKRLAETGYRVQKEIGDIVVLSRRN